MSAPDNHTPGPWRVSEASVYAGGDYIEIADPFNGFDYEEGRLLPIDERQANANLIAAAPDLLERLKQCAEVLAAEGGHEGGLWLDEIRITIAKAEGRQ